MKALNGLLFLFNVAFLAMSAYFVLSRGYIPSRGWGGYELVTVMLAGIAVLLTALGIFVALLAIWGFGTLRASARKISEKESRKVAKKVAESVAARVAEKIAQQRHISAGGERSDDYGLAAGKEDSDGRA